MIVDIVSNSSNQCGHVRERTSTDAFDDNLAEPRLDQVQPGTGCWNKVQMEPWMPFESGLHAGMFVGAVIVREQMQIEPSRGLSVYSLDETDKFLMPMARHAVGNHFAVEDTEGCK